MALIQEDLPTLERPTIIISGLKGSAGGQCSREGAEVIKVAFSTERGRSISFQLTTGVAFVLAFTRLMGAVWCEEGFLSGFFVVDFCLVGGVGGVVICKGSMWVEKGDKPFYCKPNKVEYTQSKIRGRYKRLMIVILESDHFQHDSHF
jgi:hypothetical protein